MQKGYSLEHSVDSVLEAIPLVWDRIRSNLRAAATQRFGITLEQFHILRHIRRGFCHVGDLADKKQISRSAVSQAVDVLAAKGLVTRLRESGDRRLVRLELTAHATGVMDSNFLETRDWMKRKMESLSSEELKNIAEAMETLEKVFTGTEC
ncbi:MAG: MarR family transcriptional regulator [Rectinemataceae bacterium]